MPAPRKTRGPWVLLTVAAALMVGSAITAYAEFMPLLKIGTVMDQKVASLAAELVVPGPSYRSKFRVLDDCNAALNSLEGNLLAPEPRQSLLNNCKSVARMVLAEEPTYSLAWYVDALAAEGLGDDATISTSLAQSQRMTPRQEWLARSRAILAERHMATLSAEAEEAYHQDLALLVQSRLGAAWVAQRYVTDPEFREMITAIVEQLPAAAQRQFLSAVRSAS